MCRLQCVRPSQHRRVKYSPAGRNRYRGLTEMSETVACTSPFHSHILQMGSECHSGLCQSQTLIYLWMFCSRKKKLLKHWIYPFLGLVAQENGTSYAKHRSDLQIQQIFWFSLAEVPDDDSCSCGICVVERIDGIELTEKLRLCLEQRVAQDILKTCRVLWLRSEWEGRSRIQTSNRE